MEKSSAAVEAHKASDTHSSSVQWKETISGRSSDKVHVITSDSDPMYTGDGRHEKGGTRELKVIEEVPSTSSDS